MVVADFHIGDRASVWKPTPTHYRFLPVPSDELRNPLQSLETGASTPFIFRMTHAG